MRGGALVLAAGASRRFGSDKRVFDIDGQPLLRRTVQAVLDAGLACRVCLKPEDGAIPPLLDRPGIEFIECASAQRGMGATLAEAVAACDDWDGLLVVLGDMAWVQADTLLELWRALTPDTIVQPVFGDAAGNPVGFGRRFFAALSRLEGDLGGREVVQRHRERRQLIPVDDPGILRDLDEPPSGG